MDDKEIIESFLNRDQNAIHFTEEKYGSYSTTIAMNILNDYEDARECVNDTYLKLWNSIPPQIPAILSAYIAKIVRNLAIDRFRSLRAQKHGSGITLIPLDELGDCVSGADSTAQIAAENEMISCINDFLDSLSDESRDIFVCRYWYCDSISAIAKQFFKTESGTAMTLMRIRKKLKIYLIERGFEI